MLNPTFCLYLCIRDNLLGVNITSYSLNFVNDFFGFYVTSYYFPCGIRYLRGLIILLIITITSYNTN